MIAIGRHGRIPVCLAYGQRAKWIPVESTAQPSPTNIVQSREVVVVRQQLVGKGRSLHDL